MLIFNFRASTEKLESPAIAIFHILEGGLLNLKFWFYFGLEKWQVKLVVKQADEDLAFLMAHDTDRFIVFLT